MVDCGDAALGVELHDYPHADGHKGRTLQIASITQFFATDGHGLITDFLFIASIGSWMNRWRGAAPHGR